MAEEIETKTVAAAQDESIPVEAKEGKGSSSAAAAAAAAEQPSSPAASHPENGGNGKDLPSKRPSPWRQPKSVREANYAAAADTLDWSPRGLQKTAIAEKKKKKMKLRKLLQDAIFVRIPMTVTADLAVALQRTRAKRSEALHEMFPELKVSTGAKSQPEGSAIDEDEEDKGVEDKKAEEGEGTKKNGKKKPQQAPKHMPQRHEYDNVLDYLEAKYAQGVMVDDEGANEGDDEEGQGSVYSETSFLDDKDLRRTVAEQVLAHSTATKLELQDDDEFFVNVGNLEVEETDLTQEHYDPLEDTNKPLTKRKRKKAPASADSKKKGKSAAASPKSTTLQPKKKKAKTSETTDKKETTNTSKSKEEKSPPRSSIPAEKIAKKRKARSDKLFDGLVEMIKAATPEELPRRKTKERVTLVCPEDKSPGDSILFSNPHVPGQKLKVKVPKSAKPGGRFRVTVPVPNTVDEDTDYNKLSRVFYGVLDDYARAFDDWCDAEGEYRKAIDDKDFNAHFEKRKKVRETERVQPFLELEAPFFF